jgi:predicted permease
MFRPFRVLNSPFTNPIAIGLLINSFANSFGNFLSQPIYQIINHRYQKNGQN